MAVFSSSCRVVIRSLLAASNRADLEDDQSSWYAFHCKSGLDASFQMQLAMALMHARIV